MESSQLRLIGVLAAVLIALTAALALPEPEPEPIDASATALVVPATDPSEAVAARIEQASGERTDVIELRKTDGIWRVVAPFQADADVDRVIAVLDAVRESEKGVPIPGDAAAFGLAPPQVVVTVEMADGSSRRLEVGNVAPVGWRTYARAADGSVAAVSGKPGEELLRRPQEYRDHRIFRYDPGDVRRISVESALGLLEATKASDGAWFLTGFGRVDLVELDAWVTDLLDLRVDMFLDLDHETIADPRFLVQVETDGGVQEMRVGRDTPYGPLVFWAGGLDGVVDPNLLRMLERGPTDVGVSQAFPFGDTTSAVARSGVVEGRVERPADGWEESPLVAALRDAQLVYRRDPPAWGPVELTVSLEGGTPAVIELGPVDEEGFRPLRDRAGGAPMRVPADEIAALFLP